MEISEITATELFSKMSESQKDEVYRMIWKDHVKEDIKDYSEKNGYLLDESFTDSCAEAYVNGEYDCNLSYWSNIDNLIKNH